MKNAIVNLLLIIISFAPTSAQQFPFINYTTKDGLINNNVRSIYQDRVGRMYFGTFSGLTVYDGSRFTNYTKKNGLVSNIINQVMELGPDSMLIIPNGPGLNLLVRGIIKQYKTKDNFCPVINEMVLCSNGKYYALGDEGLYKLENGKCTKIDISLKLPGMAGKNLYHGTCYHNLLFINSNIKSPVYPGRPEFFVFNIITGEILNSSQIPIINYSILSPNKEILVATKEGIEKIDLIALAKGKIQLAKAKNYKALSPTEITYMYFDNQNNLWLASLKGIIKISKESPPRFFTKENGLPLNLFTCIFQDKENIMWFGNEEMGITKLVNENIQFYPEIKKNFTASDLFASVYSDSVWFYDAGRNALSMLYHNNIREYSSYKFKMFGKLALQNNLGYLSDVSSIYRITILPNNHFAFSLAFNDSTEHLGYKSIMDKYGNTIAVSDKIVVLLANKNIISKDLDYIADFPAFSGENLLWVLTRSQKLYLFRTSPTARQNYLDLVHVYDIETKELDPRSIAIDSENNIWIGTRNNGLYCYTYNKTKLFLKLHLEVKDGLSDNFVQYLHCDKLDNLWICSPSGLDKLSIQPGNIFIDNVTLANNIHLNVFSIESDKSGTIWGLTDIGILKIHPASFVRNSNYSPSVILSEILAGNKIVNNVMKPAAFSYGENYITFKVASPSFYDEHQTHFSFMLTGKGKSYWSEPGNLAEIHYADLPPGKYVFHARAIFPKGLYPEKQALFPFEIEYPWWQSIWFYCIVILSLILILWIALRIYYKNKLTLQRMAFERQKAIEKERTRIATDMHDDLGSGLSRIAFLSETIKLKKNTGIIEDDDLNKIAGYSHEMINKMGEIVWALNEKNDSLIDLTSYTRAYCVEYLTANGLACKFNISEKIPDILLTGEIRRNIFLSVKEVLHNIIKHAHATEVNIIVTIDRDLHFIIHDNGKGIDLENRRPFSNGLNNIKARMLEINGQAKFINRNGTTVELILPLAL